jgi:hypothetical protein
MHSDKAKHIKLLELIMKKTTLLINQSIFRKKIKNSVFAVFLFGTLPVLAQNNYYPTTGNIGHGTPTSTANFNLQLHGTTNYSESDKVTGLINNYGVTSRFGLTNTTTGATANDGMLFRMSSTNFIMDNKENGNIFINSGNALMGIIGSANRAFVGGTSITGDNYGAFNVSSSDNGIFIYPTTQFKFGLSIRMNSLTDNAIQVMGSNGTTRNFSVKANGEVYARKYTTTLDDIPDYVFNSDYELMTFQELRDFISTNRHLPNVPSAKEYKETGVDLGEMNRVLLEKVEELTLYLLQLEEQMNILKTKKN